MTKEEFIDKLKAEIVRYECIYDESSNEKIKNQCNGSLRAISECLTLAKKLDVAIGSEENKCGAFYADAMSTSQTKCINCGKEKWQH